MIEKPIEEPVAEPVRSQQEIEASWRERYDASRKTAVESVEKPEEPVQITQHPETGMWHVAKPVMYISPRSFLDIPEIHSHRYICNMRLTTRFGSSREVEMPLLPEPPDEVPCVAGISWEPYAPSFVHFAEAYAWAQETVLIGTEPIRLTKDGLLAPGAGLKIIEKLEAVRQEREIIQEGQRERSAQYIEDSLF